MLRRILIAAFIITASAAVHSAELPTGATLLDPDLLWDLEPDTNSGTEIQDPVFTISPDDKRIAYISKGAIWSCDVTGGPSTKLVDLPNTKTALLASPEFQGFWQNVLAARNSTTNSRYQGRFPSSPVGVHSLAWSPNQDGVLYTFSRRVTERPGTVEYRVVHVSNQRAFKPITEFQRNTYDKPNWLYSFCVTRDLRHVVASDGYTPLIIDSVTRKPRATCFDCLVPSSSSNRFLGIEIDTRQLVLADDNFNVTQRFDVTCTARRQVDLLWSPDERYAVVREHLEHPSSDWVGFRIDLKTGEKRELEGSHFMEECQFTGHEGEVVRIGAFPSALGATYISIVPNGSEPQYDIARWPNVQQLDPSQNNGRYPAVRMSRDGTLFAMAFLRDGRSPGYRYFLIDRHGTKWSCGPDDPTRRVSPYHVVALANGGNTIVACDDSRLFSIPVELIKNATHSVAP